MGWAMRLPVRSSHVEAAGVPHLKERFEECVLVNGRQCAVVSVTLPIVKCGVKGVHHVKLSACEKQGEMGYRAGGIEYEEWDE